MKCFVLTWQQGLHGGGSVQRQELIDFLNNMPEVRNWRASLGAIFLVSEETPRALSRQVHDAFPNLLFMIAPIAIDAIWGWGDKKTWDFISNPTPTA